MTTNSRAILNVPAVTTEQFDEWLKGSKKGDQVAYLAGVNAMDSEVKTRRCPIAEHVYRAYTAKMVTLVQRRVRGDEKGQSALPFDYVAIRI